MATTQQNTDAINAIILWINAVISNSKNIDELPDMVNIVATGHLPVREGGVTQKLEIQKIITKALFDRLVVIDGKPFRIAKDNANTVNPNTLEINDVVIGYSSPSTFLMAVYRGGDQTDFTNDSIYEKFSGF
jgi:hypothetical protein